MCIKTCSSALGAEVTCENIVTADEATFRVIYQAWLSHLVLLFRGRNYSDDDLCFITQRFGIPKSPLGDLQRTTGIKSLQNPNISVISDVLEDDVPIGSLGDGEAL